MYVHFICIPCSSVISPEVPSLNITLVFLHILVCIVIGNRPIVFDAIKSEGSLGLTASDLHNHSCKFIFNINSKGIMSSILFLISLTLALSVVQSCPSIHVNKKVGGPNKGYLRHGAAGLSRECLESVPELRVAEK